MDTQKILTTRPVGNLKDVKFDESIEFLNQVLANEFTLFTKSLNYHWNVTGPRFHSMHKFLETIYQDLLPVMDDVAERVRILGGVPMSTLRSLDATKTLTEVNGQCLTADEMLGDLFVANQKIQNSINEFLKEEEHVDHGTTDFLVSLLQKHEMMSWMFKSHLH